MMVMRISSPASMRGDPNDDATRLTASVAFRVKMISSSWAAFRKARTFPRAFSKFSVAKFER
jgi:hypothetical protein